VTSNYNGSSGDNHKSNSSGSSSYKFSRDPTCNDLIATCSKDGRCLIYEGLGASNISYNQNSEELSELGVLKPIFTPSPIKPKVIEGAGWIRGCKLKTPGFKISEMIRNSNTEQSKIIR